MNNALVHQIFKTINWVLEHKWSIVVLFFLIAYPIGVIGFLDLIKDYPNEPFVDAQDCGLPSALLWGLINFINGSTDNLTNGFTIISQLLMRIGIAIAIIFTAIKSMVTSIKLKTISKVPHTLVIGLGENNRMYLESEIESNNESAIIIIEPDANNIYLKYFIDKGFGVFLGTLNGYKINFAQLERVVISTGNDRVNIEMSSMLLEMIPKNMDKDKFGIPTKVYVHIENQDYKELFKKDILSVDSNIPIDFKPYSFNDDAVRQLFEKHTVLGNYYELAKTQEAYSIVVIGNGNLAERVIYHLCIQSNLPNANHLTIHCVSKDTKLFLTRIRSKFIGIDLLKNISLKEHALDINSLEFYNSSIFQEQNLTNIIICDNDENMNFECAVNLYDKVFLRSELKSKVLFAMYHNMALSQKIDEDKGKYANFYTFGDASAICDREHFIDEKNENIAKLIHYGYEDEYNPQLLVKFNKEKTDIDTKWHDTTKFHDRESNHSQALHISTKLMSMGFRKIENTDLSPDALLEANRKIMKDIFDGFVFTEEEIIEVSKKLNSDKKDELESFFDKIIQSDDICSKLCIAEHERWNVFHHLNGWVYNEKTDKPKKIHNCLISFRDFKSIEIKQTIIYDLYATLYIPNFLASAGYKIVPIEDVPANERIDRNNEKSKKKFFFKWLSREKIELLCKKILAFCLEQKNK